MIKDKMRFLEFIFLIMVLLACNNSKKGIDHSISENARSYLNEILLILENNLVNKDKIDWGSFKNEVFELAKNSKKIEDTYPAIDSAISLLEDNHSYFKAIVENEQNHESKTLPTLLDENTPEDIGYVRVPFCIGNEQHLDEYIVTIQNILCSQNSQELKGWIIDLRNNFGGNMWPMLLALEPFFMKDTIGYFVDSEDNYKAWILTNGAVFIDNQHIYSNKLYTSLDLTDSKVAVLIDHKTASSGEATAIALKGRNKTKLFGEPSFGVSTGCVPHRLSDGSIINLAESIFTDKNKNKYGLSIMPDYKTDSLETVQRAIDWINKGN